VYILGLSFLAPLFICPQEFRACYVIPPGVRLSVRLLAIWFPEHNLSSIWPTIFKLHRRINCYLKEVIHVLYLIHMSYKCLILTKKNKNTFRHIMLILTVLLFCWGDCHDPGVVACIVHWTLFPSETMKAMWHILPTVLLFVHWFVQMYNCKSNELF
jgi:hypothetical protein